MTNSCEEAKRGCAGPGGLSPPPAASTSTWRLLQKGAGGKGRLRAALGRDRRTSEGSNSSNRRNPALAGTEIGWQVPQISIQRDEAEPSALHRRLRADRKGLVPCHKPTPGAEAFQRLVSSAAHPSRWLRPAPAAPGGLDGGAQHAPAIGAPAMGPDSAAKALQELGSEQGKGAVADACPTPRRLPPAQPPPGFALQPPQLLPLLPAEAAATCEATCCEAVC